MHKVWLDSYPAAVQPEIDTNEFASINELLARSCRKFSDRPAYRNLGTTITYAQLDRRSREFAAWLQSLPGCEGIANRPHAAESSPVPHRIFWGSARGNDCGQRQPSVHGARTGAPAQGLRAPR